MTNYLLILYQNQVTSLLMSHVSNCAFCVPHGAEVQARMANSDAEVHKNVCSDSSVISAVLERRMFFLLFFFKIMPFAVCLENIVCLTSCVKRRFESKHEKSFKNQADRAESIRRAVSDYEKQTSTLHVYTAS